MLLLYSNYEVDLYQNIQANHTAY